jgi:hypothetical protein
MHIETVYVVQYNSKVGPKFHATGLRYGGISATTGPVGLTTEHLRTVTGSRSAQLAADWPSIHGDIEGRVQRASGLIEPEPSLDADEDDPSDYEDFNATSEYEDWVYDPSNR